MPTASNISRSTNADLAGMLAQQASVIPRKLLRITTYSHPKLKTIHALEVAGDVADGPVEPSLIWARDAGEGFRVIGSRMRCWDCRGTGMRGTVRCPHCKKTGWVYGDGVDLARPGKVIATRELA